MTDAVSEVKPATTGGPPPGGSRRVVEPDSVVLRRLRMRRMAARYGVLALLALTVVTFGVAEPDRFLTQDTLMIIIHQTSVAAVVAFGVTMVLVLRHFDLSIVGVMGLSGALAVHLMLQGVAWPVAALVGVATGAAVGAVNGVFVAVVGASSFVATLATGSVATALEFHFSGQVQINEGISEGFLDLGAAEPLGLELTTWLALGVAALLWVVLERSEYGRVLRAVGGNADASRFSGVRGRRVQVAAFAVAGAAAAVTGLVLVAESAAYAPDAGAPLLIPTYAAVFIGAAVLRPGVMTIVGTVVGLLFLAVVESGLTIVGVAGWAGQVTVGVVLMVAILLSRMGGEHD
ncbi:ABC transporter permease [Nocardioides sp. TF02-7]|uniref:ABC transporter permease n=1 Tax=Nocardioides sp. TF02-7 TaxID=2917724 RepID=UPI001F06DA46|nr:ABC transporter permease [Nocardioides sp. TF02-7]UMG91191.1 ABC transporter permease [Nocardioides sp. TF02-7]